MCTSFPNCAHERVHALLTCHVFHKLKVAHSLGIDHCRVLDGDMVHQQQWCGEAHVQAALGVLEGHTNCRNSVHSIFNWKVAAYVQFRIIRQECYSCARHCACKACEWTQYLHKFQLPSQSAFQECSHPHHSSAFTESDNTQLAPGGAPPVHN